MLVEITSNRTPGPDINIHCPTCDHETAALTYELAESLSILGKGPFLATSHTWVQCIRCGERQLSQVPPKRLKTLNAWQLKQLVGGNVPPRAKQFTIGALALFLVPIVGIIVGLLAVLDTLRISGWPRIASRVALGLALAVNLALAAVGIGRMIPAGENRDEVQHNIAASVAPLLPVRERDRIQAALANLTPGLTLALTDRPGADKASKPQIAQNTPASSEPLAANEPKFGSPAAPADDNALADLPAFNETPAPAPASAPPQPQPAHSAAPVDDSAGVAAEPQLLPEDAAGGKASSPAPPAVAPKPKPAPAPPPAQAATPAPAADDPGGVAAEPQALADEVAPPPKPAMPAPPNEAPAPLADIPAKDARWQVVFAGRDPKAWNTEGTLDTIARPLASVAADIRWLRLKRLDTGDYLIMPITQAELNGKSEFRNNPNQSIRWCGSNQDIFGGRHLGIVEGPLIKASRDTSGVLAVQVEGVDYAIGSGFGHIAFGDGKTQHFGWRGVAIPPTTFEIAVMAGDLNAAEQAKVVGQP